MANRTASLIGSGSYVPDRIRTNEDLEDRVGVSDDWIYQRTGIRERRIADEDQASSDLGVKAAEDALDEAGLEPEAIDQIIVATITPDMSYPSTSCMIQDKLDAGTGAAFDISAACSGFIYGMAMANGQIQSGCADTVLLVGTEVLSKFTNWEDRDTGILFGDAAGAWVLQHDSGLDYDPFGSICLEADGAYQDILSIPAGGSARPVDQEVLDKNLQYMQMDGSTVFKVAVRKMKEAAVQALEKASMDPSELDWVICHQANVRIIDAVQDKLDLPSEKMIVNIENYGNTSAASIPLAFDEAKENNRIQPGDDILTIAFGGGLTWASSVFTPT